MKINKFRIWNYKSIVDSGDFYPAERVTVLAGKNESGKSSILEALEDFNGDQSIRDKAISISASSGELPKISIWFEVPSHDLLNIIDEMEVRLDVEVPEKTVICVSKTYPDQYEIEGEFIEKLKENNRLIDVLDQAAQIVNKQAGAMDTKDLEDKFKEALLLYVPNFILFSSFDDVFPNMIPLAELKTNKWIADLAEMSDIDVNVITGQSSRDKKSHKTALNLSINKDFRKFWEQDTSHLSVDWDNEKLEFWIEEGGRYYEPEIRSQGRRWHLAFYVRVSARAREDVRNIILIDEPGLYLHANAQRDVLKNLEESGKEAPVIFSTHSPYLIEPDKLERVRLIQKDGDGTKIENKIHRVSDKETLTPILTAIGMDLNRGLVAVEKKSNVVVEGASDYFYLNAFKRLLLVENLNFVSGGSSGNMPKVGTILQGWGCNVVYLFDNDQAYKDAQKCIRREWLTINKDVVAKLPVDGAIEDLLTKQEFSDYVLEIPVENVIGKNSEHMKGRDKVLVAKNFLEKVVAGRVSISPETKRLIEKLMDDLTSRVEAGF